jgi:putative Mg2+ transporter-C (MgtC) family protein
MPLDWTSFAIRLLIAFFLAVGIGIERQWLKSRAVLKTNVLVTLGAAMFTMLSIMTPGDASPTRIAAQIVSGVGFLGGGVILRDGGSVKGTNTAATIWCAAAIGSLVGSGFFIPAYLSTLAVVGANLLGKPLEDAFKKQRDKERQSLPLTKMKLVKNLEIVPSLLEESSLSSESLNDYQYCCDVLCLLEAETQVFDLINQFAQKHSLKSIKTQSLNIPSQTQTDELAVEIKVNFTGQGKKLDLSDSEEIIRLLKSDGKVNSVSWQLLST